MTTIEALQLAEQTLAAAGVETPRLDAEVLLAHLLARPRAELYLDRGSEIDRETIASFQEAIERRASGCPVAYLTGSREFWTRTMRVTSAVLIPRPETETVVEEALRRCPDRATKLRALDLCTGSGCIAAALAAEFPAARITATDQSAAALAVARENLAFAADRIDLREGDLFAALEEDDAPFDLVTANPPYIAEGEFPQLPREVRCAEPRLALAGGEDGLDFVRRIVEDAPRHLVPGGWLVMEVGATQAPACQALAMAHGGYDTIGTTRDLAGIERVVALRRTRFPSEA